MEREELVARRKEAAARRIPLDQREPAAPARHRERQDHLAQAHPRRQGHGRRATRRLE